MLDPLTALSVVGNIVQFIEFGLKTTSKAREIYQSPNGTVQENTGIEALTEDIASVTAKFKTSAATTGSDSLDEISQRCATAANELLGALKHLKVEGDKSKWKSVRKGLKAVWGKKRVEEMRARLLGWRDEIQFHVLVELKCTMDITATKQMERFDSLDENAKAVLETLSVMSKSIQDAIQAESGKSDQKHEQTTIAIVAKQEETQVEMTQAIQTMDASSRAEHEATQRELKHMKEALDQIRQDMLRRDTELKELLSELSKAHNSKERKKLQERSNAVTVALCALVTIYENLQRIVLALQAQAKMVILSTSFSFKPLASTELEPMIYETMAEGLLNRPSIATNDLVECYLFEFDKHYTESWSGFLGCQKRDFKWRALETINYETIREDEVTLLPYSLNEIEGVKKHLLVLLSVLDSNDSPQAFKSRIAFEAITRLSGVSPNYNGVSELKIRYFSSYELIDIMIILSTALAEYLGSATLASLTLSAAFMDVNSDSMGDARIESCILAGRMAGLDKEAQTMLRLRYWKWDIRPRRLDSHQKHGESPWPALQQFLTWLKTNSPPNFIFSITTSDPTHGARIYALVEFLVKVGFDLNISFGMIMGSQNSDNLQSSEVQACVTKRCGKNRGDL